MGFHEFVKNILKSEVFRGSFALMMLTNVGHVLNYLYHFIMARMLGPSDYGILAVLTSIMYIFAIPTLSIQTIMSKRTTKLMSKDEYGKVKGALYYLIRKVMLFALIGFVIFALISWLFLSRVLGIEVWLLVLLGTFLFGTFIHPIALGILQGLKKFKEFGWNFIIDCAARLVIGIVLVFLGFRVYGAILGTILGVVIAFFFAFPFMKEVTSAKQKPEKVMIFSQDSLSTFLAMIIIVFLYSFDVILAKTFFAPDLAGRYAVASLIGKIIFFVMMAIGNAMFPISSEKFVDGKGDTSKSKDVVRHVGLGVFVLCVLAVAAFAIMPNFIISILFGSEYLSVAPILIYTGTAFSFISFMYVFILYKISIDEFRGYHVIFLAILFATQILLFFRYHASIEQFSIIFAISSAIVFLGSYFLVRKWER